MLTFTRGAKELGAMDKPESKDKPDYDIPDQIVLHVMNKVYRDACAKTNDSDPLNPLRTKIRFKGTL